MKEEEYNRIKSEINQQSEKRKIYCQKRKIQAIQLHIKNYRDNPYIQLTNEDISDHIYHLDIIATLTWESKVARKAVKVRDLLLRIQDYRIRERRRRIKDEWQKDTVSKETQSTK